MALPKQKIAERPESEAKISDLVHKLLRDTDSAGVLPTPIERLFELAKVTNIDALPDDTYLQTLTEQSKRFIRSAWQKLRGIADLKERATYVPHDPLPGRELFAKTHELGHQVIPWHNIDPTYLDDNESLGPNARLIFEREASFFGSDTIFQGPRFRLIARDFQPTFDAIFTLADQHGSSKQATAWRFVEEQDEALALVQYYPGNAIDQEGNPVLNVWCSVGSPAFNRRFPDIDLPLALRSGHPWVAARDYNQVFTGHENLAVGGQSVAFEWHAWWNSYALLVLLRRKPIFSVVGGFLRGS